MSVTPSDLQDTANNSNGLDSRDPNVGVSTISVHAGEARQKAITRAH